MLGLLHVETKTLYRLTIRQSSVLTSNSANSNRKIMLSLDGNKFEADSVI